MNPFDRQADDLLRGSYVRVRTSDGVEIEGWLDRRHHNQRHVLLRDVVVDQAEEGGAAVVSDPPLMIEMDSASRIESVPLSKLEPAPYHSGEWEAGPNRDYIEQVQERGFAGSYPVVRERGDGFEIVEGHKRIWVCEQAGLEEHPVEIVELGDWPATLRFVFDHLPVEKHLDGDGSRDGVYSDEQTAAAVLKLVDRWDDRALDLDRVAFNVDRLGLTQGSDGADRQEPAVDDSPTRNDPEDSDSPGRQGGEGQAAGSGGPGEVEDYDSFADWLSSHDRVGRSTASRIETHGYTSLDDFEGVTVDDLTEIPYIGSVMAGRMIDIVDAGLEQLDGDDSTLGSGPAEADDEEDEDSTEDREGEAGEEDEGADNAEVRVEENDQEERVFEETAADGGSETTQPTNQGSSIQTPKEPFEDWNGTKATKNVCGGCGSQLPKDWHRVMAPDGVEVSETCPNCSSKTERRDKRRGDR